MTSDDRIPSGEPRGRWSERHRGKLIVAGLALLGGILWRRRRQRRIDVGRVSETWLAEREFESGRDSA